MIGLILSMVLKGFTVHGFRCSTTIIIGYRQNETGLLGK